MRRLFMAAAGLTAAAGALLGVVLYRDETARRELDAQTAARSQIESFISEAPGQVVWSRPEPTAEPSQEPAAPADIQPLYGTYQAPEGFTLLSYSAAWDDDMLRCLYEELMANAHGEEIYALESVVVHAGGGQEDVLGMQQQQDIRYEIRLSHPTLLPPGLSLDLESRTTVIHLYNGDSRTTVASMADTLSHEYGHHFTNYYFFGGSADTWLSSDYARIRGLTSEEVFGEVTDYDHYIARHQWYIQEIAADDYVALMGSPATRQTCAYYDIHDWLMADLNGDTLSDDGGALAFNARPHENMSLPFPTAVSGLTEYFYGFIGGAPSWGAHTVQPITLTVTPRSRSYDLVSGHAEYRYAQIEWNCPYTEGNPLYTLVCYDENDQVLAAVRTVQGQTRGEAFIGNVVHETSKLVYSLDDNLASGVRRFRVTVLFEDGWIIVSDPVEYDFGG